MEALQYLEGQTDAKGRRLEVVKLPCPPPLYISEEESRGITKVEGTMPREVSQLALELTLIMLDATYCAVQYRCKSVTGQMLGGGLVLQVSLGLRKALL